ncbi:MAG TPA: CHAT domain-containing protein [Candidatus Tectomicrobia bacterium]
MYEQELAEIFEKLKRESLTVFVGSDLPEALAGLPGRQALADALAAQEGMAPGLRLAAVAQQVMNRGSRWDFTSFLIQALEPDGVVPGPFYQKLARLVQSARPALIITTAYHRLLELALQHQGVACNSVVRDEAIPFIDPRRTTLLKLYGEIQQVDTLVVTEQDQNALLRGRDKPDMVDEVRHAFRRTGLLFFGYDLRDPAVGTLFDEVAGNRFQARSYAVWPDLSQREMESFERNRGLTVLAMDPVSVVQALLDDVNVAPKGKITPSVAEAIENPEVDCTPQNETPQRQQKDYVDLEIRLLGKREFGYPVEVSVAGGPDFQRGYMDSGIIPWISTSSPEQDGERLFALLVQDWRTRSAWDQAKGYSTQRRIRLHIDEDAPELDSVPWELLREPIAAGVGQAVAASSDTPFSRYLPAPHPRNIPRIDLPLRILIAIANPSGLDHYNLQPIDVEEEYRNVQQATTGLAVSLVKMDERLTLVALQRELRNGYDVLHFVGHGMYSKSRGSALALSDEDGEVALAHENSLAEMIGNLRADSERLRLMYLSSCRTAVPNARLAFRSLASMLVRVGVPAVIAMQDTIEVTTAREFAATFYGRLLVHGQVDLAANEARSTIAAASLPGSAIPVLYMRLSDGHLFRANSTADRGSRTTMNSIGPQVARLDANTRVALRELLADLYPDIDSARRIVADARLGAHRIAFSGNATNTWHAILTEAETTNGVARLVDVVLREYADNPLLIKVINAIRADGGNLVN